jgi:hypothetical protein
MAIVARLRTLYQTAVRRAHVLDDDSGDEQSREHVEGVAVKGLAQRGRGLPAPGEEDGGHGIGQARDRGEHESARDYFRYGEASAERRGDSFHDGAGGQDHDQGQGGDAGVALPGQERRTGTSAAR